MKYVPEIKKNLKKIVLPVDFAVEVDVKRKNLSLDEFPSKLRAMDIGDGTIELFSKEIKKARCVFLKGTAGFAEDERFAKGTKELLKAVASCKGFSMIGGGHTTTTLREMGINKNT